ncbi:unnamed protein product [Penicillium salamii]|uniref:Amidohydrolase-related domain-containing protein n=1 Tax=Penicillium salamii TaxID=1612424 RepID=A0A9W4MXQ1_9EURO|nr:unnamed protein product [Penicillium salamii]CAG8397348.1 unnamed protein product [Penicillium salamii]CAG8418124.1 unnamed protein product [Penicillium salamii]CAG8418537.1 unnamed protein product [Penicillium salamii]
MPGLGDSHTHLTWNDGGLDRLGSLGLEEHTLLTARSAKCFLDSGYTMCFGAASAKKRLDIVVRDAINAGHILGPRYLANGQEIARAGGELVEGITVFANGAQEMREVIRGHAQLGVDQVKLSMSGESITEIRDAEDCYFTPEETAACVQEAHRHRKRVCSHARARDSIQQSVDHGVDVIYHASFVDEKGMDALEKNKSKLVIAPAINWIVATLYDAGTFGYSTEKAEQVGYKRELDAADRAMREMHQRGIVRLWICLDASRYLCRDLAHFVDRFGFTPHESIIAATYGMAKLFMRSHEMGQIKDGNLADCLVVNGNPLQDISILRQHDRLDIIMINGRVHKASSKEAAFCPAWTGGLMESDMLHRNTSVPVVS